MQYLKDKLSVKLTLICAVDGSCHIHKRGCMFPGLERNKHCPEFGQVARNSFGIHGVVSPEFQGHCVILVGLVCFLFFLKLSSTGGTNTQ